VTPSSGGLGDGTRTVPNVRGRPAVTGQAEVKVEVQHGVEVRQLGLDAVAVGEAVLGLLVAACGQEVVAGPQEVGAQVVGQGAQDVLRAMTAAGTGR